MHRTKPKSSAARAFLLSYLKRGCKPQNEVFLAAADAGINKHTLEKSSREIHIIKRKGTHPTLGQCNYWGLPDPYSAKPAEAAPSGDRLREEYGRGYAAGAEAVAHEVRSVLAAIRLTDGQRDTFRARIERAIARAPKSARY
ncbi:hypothetical protein AB4Y44_19035 [Paraburkholderia sp. BR10937]|uniref:hypothetical protein n=1 Tax=Paraburkholderia sp. BR10937 TaxID=3236994 RepID=UPI0034D28850